MEKKKLSITKIMPMKQRSGMKIKLLHKKAAPGERVRSGLGGGKGWEREGSAGEGRAGPAGAVLVLWCPSWSLLF